MRLLSVDPGEKRIGIAVTDEGGTIALPLEVIEHQSRHLDAIRIIHLAEENHVERILIGCALGTDGELSASGRSAKKLAEEVERTGKIIVELVDEYGTTNVVQQAALSMGLRREKRRSHRDELAAVVILQQYLETHGGDAIEES